MSPPPSAPDLEAEGQQVSCNNCGAKNPVAFAFCGNCGNRLGPSPQETLFRGASAGAEAKPQPQIIARLALIRPDGSEGGSFDLVGDEVVVGRESGRLFEADAYLSPHHARFTTAGDQITIEDAGSLNGVFVRITAPERLETGDAFRIGQELLRFDTIGEPEPTEDGTDVLGSPNPGYWGRLSLIVRRGIHGSAFPLMGDEMVLGRERGDILFSDDGYVSGTHAKLTIDDQGEVLLSDLGSSNGTFIRLRAPRTVPYGTFLLMGQQLFRLEEPAH